MKVLLLTTSYPRRKGDDAGIFVERLVNAFEAIGLEGTVVVPQDRDESTFERRGRFSISRFRYGIFSKGSLAFGSGILPNIRANKLLALQIPALLFCMFRQTKILAADHDIIHTNWLVNGIAAWGASLASGKPYTLTVRGEDMILLNVKLLRPFLMPILRRASLLATVNEDFVTQLQALRGLDPKKIRTIPNGVAVEMPSKDQLQDFASSNKIELNKPSLLYIGRMIPIKGVKLLLDLIARKNLHHYNLILCGRFDESYVQLLYRTAEELKISERVTIRGRIPPNEVPYYLAAATVYVSASSFEGRPNAMLEALCAGVPVVASNIAMHKEIVKHRENGFLFDPENLEEAESILLELEVNSALREKISLAAKESVKAYSWDSSAKLYLQAFDSIFRNNLTNS